MRLHFHDRRNGYRFLAELRRRSRSGMWDARTEVVGDSLLVEIPSPAATGLEVRELLEVYEGRLVDVGTPLPIASAGKPGGAKTGRV